MEIDEEKILADFLRDYGTDKYYDRISEITGVYVLGSIENGEIKFSVDPAGMQSACYGVIDGHFFLSSHPQLIGDICSLKMDDFVKELVNYKWYGRVMGPYLPADLSPFANVKRIIPSTEYTYDGEKLSHKRFWPLKPFEFAEGAEYDRVIEEAADILKKNMELISKNGNIRGFPSQAELTVTPPLQLQTECMTDLRRSVISPPKRKYATPKRLQK